MDLVKEGLKDIKNYLLKPVESFKDSKNDDIKKVGINAGITVVVMMLVNLVCSMITAVTLFGGVDFDNLNDLDYVSLIFKNLLIYAVVIAAIAAVFYIGTLIIKKEVKFSKFLAAASIAAIAWSAALVVITILGIISDKIAVAAVIIGMVYVISLFAHLVNSEVKLEDYKLVLYNVACYSVIFVTSYYIITNYIKDSILGMF